MAEANGTPRDRDCWYDLSGRGVLAGLCRERCILAPSYQLGPPHSHPRHTVYSAEVQHEGRPWPQTTSSEGLAADYIIRVGVGFALSAAALT